ncbi:hypothetical protein [Rhodococcus sp. (in: high G+C Gram-positive bacteria)]|uniref:hypothetical protein n=1 Tax=Rhodococcus sp. TaxID=1831 RepID=UPI003B8A911B
MVAVDAADDRDHGYLPADPEDQHGDEAAALDADGECDDGEPVERIADEVGPSDDGEQDRHQGENPKERRDGPCHALARDRCHSEEDDQCGHESERGVQERVLLVAADRYLGCSEREGRGCCDEWGGDDR